MSNLSLGLEPLTAGCGGMVTIRMTSLSTCWGGGGGSRSSDKTKNLERNTPFKLLHIDAALFNSSTFKR